jgi:hypothetical protein
MWRASCCGPTPTPVANSRKYNLAQFTDATWFSDEPQHDLAAYGTDAAQAQAQQQVGQVAGLAGRTLKRARRFTKRSQDATVD